MREARRSNSVIAAELGTTRSAISGKIRRLGLPLVMPQNAHHEPRGGKYHD